MQRVLTAIFTESSPCFFEGLQRGQRGTPRCFALRTLVPLPHPVPLGPLGTRSPPEKAKLSAMCISRKRLQPEFSSAAGSDHKPHVGDFERGFFSVRLAKGALKRVFLHWPVRCGASLPFQEASFMTKVLVHSVRTILPVPSPTLFLAISGFAHTFS